MFLTSTFAFRSAEEGAEFFDVVAGRKPAPEGMGAGGLVYSRFNHPNTEIVEDRLALFDGAESALVTASGMAAIGAVMLTYLRPGDALVHYTPLYGGTETLIGKVLPGWGIHPVPFTDGTAEEPLRRALEEAARHGPVKMVYLETPANPTNAMIDLALARATVDAWARDSGQTPLVVCDNTMLGPVFQTPLAHGVDICVYSLTKYVGGHSDLIAGGITGSQGAAEAGAPDAQRLRLPARPAFLLDAHALAWRRWRCAWSGPPRAGARSPGGSRRTASFPAPCCIRSSARTGRFAEIYARQCTGPGSTFAFVVENDRALAFRILNALELFKLAVSLGGTESLVCHPASTTHSGVPQAVRERRRRHRGADPPVGRTGAPGRPDPRLGPSLSTGVRSGGIDRKRG